MCIYIVSDKIVRAIINIIKTDNLIFQAFITDLPIILPITIANIDLL